MKALSFLPAATHIIYELGLEDQLHGVTFECPSDKAKVVRSYLEDQHYSSAEIDQIVSEHKRDDKALYYIDMALLQSIAPDVIFTQHVCDVCQIGTAYVEQAIQELAKTPTLIPLVPRRLQDVFDNVQTIADALGAAASGQQLITSCQQRINSIVDRLRAEQTPPRRVMLIEWMDPIYNCGHWIPYQIGLAGGVDALSNPAGYSVPTDWSRIQAYDPEVIVIAPCGFDIARTAEEIPVMQQRPGWAEMSAVKNGRVFLADANLFTRPSMSLVDGIELLAALFHPELFQVPANLVNLYRPVAARKAELS